MRQPDHPAPEPLHEALRMTRPFATVAQEAYLAIAIVADRLDYECARLLRTEDLTLAQYNILRILRGAGATGHPCNEIAVRLLKPVPDLTRVLDRMAARGLIERSREDDDRRVVRVRVLDEGLDVLQRLDQPMNDLHEQQLSGLSELDRRRLIRLLERIRR